MTDNFSPELIVQDIKFELVQSAIRQDEIGQSLQAMRKFQSELRIRLLDVAKDSKSGREIVAQQSQFNEMVLTLLQEMGNELVQLEQQQRGLNQWTRRYAISKGQRDANPAEDSEVEHSTMQWLEELGLEELRLEELRLEELAQSDAPFISEDANASLSTEDGYASLHAAGSANLPHAAGSGRTDADIVAAMKKSALDVSLDARPVRIPVVGWLLHRIRAAFHSLAHFYTQRLAQQQADVNQTYGARLLELSEENRLLHRQLERLARELHRQRPHKEEPDAGDESEAGNE